mmetsp:Transcript_17877/g.22019  ORF Transcript_17877/g.22019 Transcript_17877/m.22019 type:complete len:198 (-) Transcript_17877:2023-2616(-)
MGSAHSSYTGGGGGGGSRYDAPPKAYFGFVEGPKYLKVQYGELTVVFKQRALYTKKEYFNPGFNLNCIRITIGVPLKCSLYKKNWPGFNDSFLHPSIPVGFDDSVDSTTTATKKIEHIVTEWRDNNFLGNLCCMTIVGCPIATRLWTTEEELFARILEEVVPALITGENGDLAVGIQREYREYDMHTHLALYDITIL